MVAYDIQEKYLIKNLATQILNQPGGKNEVEDCSLDESHVQSSQARLQTVFDFLDELIEYVKKHNARSEPH
ncbi:hypothetical protein H6G89_30070 [Oscillatoria sp. FACHB-1407]|uniref:hypothetical protein n=1 Tax=Oscillatoria sp. FACHB-1407 TaxID=2692847 RepID=UPI001688DC78|nr:hypothetical protein [Oscillatoria sp. FACHB-1407]MBD2465259.1 hypothetical protein [Oscillatoria sp. FACHB-1407]